MDTLLWGKNEIIEKIKSGKTLLLAGDEKVLTELPKGNWIGGTIPYFMDSNGGRFSQEKIYATELPDYVTDTEIQTYNSENIHTVYMDAPDNGFSVIIIPATSNTHLQFSLNAPNYDEFAARPLIGWISGVALDELSQNSPKVFNGSNPSGIQDGAVVMHVTLPAGKRVEIGIVNIFKQGEGDELVFPEDSFSVRTVSVNGKEENFATYLTEKSINTQLPLVADMFGAMINTSFQNINTETRIVNLYAPVFAGMRYRIAEPVDDYVNEFRKQIPEDVGDNLFFSCNCILNYLFAELEGKQTSGFTGPITFGEIAYQLLNQTLAYLTIENV